MTQIAITPREAVAAPEAKADRKFYPFLDGIRGMAAIFVLTRHTESYWDFSIFRSYLGVDIFFVLSGFVIAFAYEGKLQSGAMSTGRFALVRIIRLYPVYFLAMVLCHALAAMNVPLNGGVRYGSLAEIATSFALSLFFLPTHAGNSSALFPSNIPCWSLFYELIVNFLYALFRPMLNTAVLTAILATTALVIAGGTLSRGTLNFGFNWSVASIVGGGARAAFGIFAGILLFRKGPGLLAFIDRRLGVAISPWLAFVLIGGILALPSAGRLDPFIDLAAVFVVFPLLVLLSTRGTAGKGQPLLLVLGAASYPMYVLHVPLGEALAHVAGPGLERFAPLSGFVFVLGLVGVALLVERIYDLPVRRWLSKTLLRTPVRERREAIAS
jgi:peptidoglycan/LPS O-acetylase OafA/YrhL